MKKKFTYKNLLKKRFIIPAVIVVIILVISILGKKNAKNVIYSEYTVERTDIVNYLEFSGTVKATDSKIIYSEVSAAVTDLLVEEGDEVHKGDILAYLDTSDIEYNIEAKELSLKSSEDSNYYSLKSAQKNLSDIQTSINKGLNATVNAAQKQLLNAQESYCSAVDSYNDTYDSYLKAKQEYESDSSQSIISAKQSVENAQLSFDTLESDSTRLNLNHAKQNLELTRKSVKEEVDNLKNKVDSAYENMQKAEADLASAQIDYDTTLLSINQNIQSYKDQIEQLTSSSSNSRNSSELDLNHTKESLEDYIIYAPMDGYITDLNLKLGEKFISTSPAATITSFDEMEVTLNIDEYDISKVSKGMPVEIYVNSLNQTYEGEISNIAMTATSSNGVSYISATASFDTDGTVMSGLSCEIKLIKDHKENVIAVLESAISYRDDHTAYVLIKNSSGQPEERTVTLGASDGTVVEILEGLNEGDVIFYTPASSTFEMKMSM